MMSPPPATRDDPKTNPAKPSPHLLNGGSI
jgi:hypothetical protein